MIRGFAIAGLVWIASPLAAAAQSAAPAPVEVFLRIAAPLDEPRGLCVDIPGHRDGVDVNRALVVHTCKWDIWDLDERFDADALARGELRMPAYGLCVGASPAAGAALKLEACDDAPSQRWSVDAGRYRNAADPALCLTVGAEPSELTSGGRRLPSRHVARSLALEPCRPAAAERQVWRAVPPQP